MDRESDLEQFVALRLGVSDNPIELGTRADSQYATRLMAQQVQVSLDVLSRDLDPELYERQYFLDAVSGLCLRNRKARLRFLVQQPLAAVRRCPRLIELCRKLSSSIEVRRPHEDYRQYNEAFMIADQVGVIHRPLADRFEGTANFYAPIEAGRRHAFFTEVWEKSEVHPEFRRLNL